MIIDGPWDAPRIYPEMQGILDNPDAAYAKLREMGKGLFGPNGAGLGGDRRAVGGPGRRHSQGLAAAASRRRPRRPGDLLGGQLGETIGNLLQQGLSGLGRQRQAGAAEPGPAAARPAVAGPQHPVAGRPRPAPPPSAAGPAPERCRRRRKASR